MTTHRATIIPFYNIFTLPDLKTFVISIIQVPNFEVEILQDGKKYPQTVLNNQNYVHSTA